MSSRELDQAYRAALYSDFLSFCAIELDWITSLRSVDQYLAVNWIKPIELRYSGFLLFLARLN